MKERRARAGAKSLGVGRGRGPLSDTSEFVSFGDSDLIRNQLDCEIGKPSGSCGKRHTVLALWRFRCQRHHRGHVVTLVGPRLARLEVDDVCG